MIDKNFLFVMRTPPHHGIHLQETLDMLLTLAAFEQKLSLLFLDDGVFQIKKAQQAEKQMLKETLCIFNALEMYDVNSFYIEAESMIQCGLNPSDLSLPVEVIERKHINALMRRFDLIISG